MMNYSGSVKPKIMLRDHYCIECHEASMRHFLPTKGGIHEVVRWLIQLPYGYRIYRLYDGSRQVGYCVISNGGNPRYPFVKKRDILIGPYYISESYRGRGLAKCFVKSVLDEYKSSFNCAWAFIQHSNIASQKTVEFCGMKHEFDASYTTLTRRLKQVPDKGEMMVFRLCE